MPSPISPAARRYVRSRATAVMQYRCNAERVVPGGFNNVSLIGSSGDRTLIIEDSPCRIWEIQGASAVALGETEIMVQNVQLSLPWDSEVLKKSDEIVITFAPTQDITVLGKRFEIISSAKAGELRATRRYSVRAIER
jgi:hypothetical protein